MAILFALLGGTGGGLALAWDGEEAEAAPPLAAEEGEGMDLRQLGVLGLFGGGGAEEALKKAAARPEEPPKALAGYDSRMGGFYIQSPDGKFLLRANARIQVRYTYFGKDDQGSASPGDLGRQG